MTQQPDFAFISMGPFYQGPKLGHLAAWVAAQTLGAYTGEALYLVQTDEALAPKPSEVLDLTLAEQKYFFFYERRQLNSLSILAIGFNVPQNAPAARALSPTRASDALVIAMAMARLLRHLNISPRALILGDLYGIGFCLERTRFLMTDYNLTFEEARALSAGDTALIYDEHKDQTSELDFLSLSRLLKNYAAGFGLNWARFLKLGSIGESLEEKTFSFKKLATHFVTLWPTLGDDHARELKNELARLHPELDIQDFSLSSMGQGLTFQGDETKTAGPITVVFDVRGENISLLREIFEHPRWRERYEHRLHPFKTVFLKDANTGAEAFETSLGAPFAPDQILLDSASINDLEDFARQCTLYVRGKLAPGIESDLLSFYLHSHGALLFMDDRGFWQRGFRFEFGRRWEAGEARADYFIQQFFDVLLPLFGAPESYQKTLRALKQHFENSYAPMIAAEQFKANFIGKLASFHDHLYAFNLSNFKIISKSSDELRRYWDGLAGLLLNIEGDYFMLERGEMEGAFSKSKASFFDAKNLSIDLDLYAPKISANELHCELVSFDEAANIMDIIPIPLEKSQGEGSNQVLSYKLPFHEFSTRRICGIRLIPRLGHFEFPFEVKLSAWF